MRGVIVVVILAMSCGGGRALHEEPLHNASTRASLQSKPTLDEAKAALQAFTEATPFLSDQIDAATALRYLANPLWTDGISYSDVRDKQLSARCKELPKTLATSQQLKAFVECTSVADYGYSGLRGADGIDEISIARIPEVFAKHRSRLSELASDHIFVYGHFCPAAPGDYWTLMALTKDGSDNVLIDAILVANDEEGDCREEPKEP